MLDFRFNGEILCMGSINMDLVMVMEHLPVPGETIVTDNFSTYPGGKGGNQAVTAAVQGSKVTMLSKLGGDSFSEQLIEAMRARGVDTSRILRDREKTAGIAIIRVDRKGQNSISFTPGSNAFLTPEDVLENSDLFAPGKILLLTMEISLETIYAALRLAAKRGMFVIVDPAPAPSTPFPADIPQLIDIVKPNESEASALTGIEVRDEKSAEEAAKQLKEMGFKLPVVTLGEAGVIAWVDGSLLKIPPVKVECVDTTAAGDVFSGTLASALSLGRGLEEALEIANCAGALSTTVAGAQTSIPDREEVERLFEKRV
jgi:ribokinase